LTSDGRPSLVSCGVEKVNIIPMTTRRGRSTGIDDDRFEPTMMGIDINGSIMVTRGLVCALGSALCAEGMVLRAVRKGNMRGGTAKAATHTHRGGNPRSMDYAAVIVDNRPMACDRRGSLPHRGISAGWDMEGQVGMLRRCIPRFPEYRRRGHTPVVVVMNVDFTWRAH
jgi:hypothetical protein